ncbi:MAG: hypothetical protein Q9163_005377 [Psora crenata]
MDYQSPNYAFTPSPQIPLPRQTANITYFSALADREKPYISPYAQDKGSRSKGSTRRSGSSEGNPADIIPSLDTKTSIRGGISAYSSCASETSSAHSSPRAKQQRSSVKMSASKVISSADKEQMLRSLRTHRVNTLTELRRIEKSLASDRSEEVTEAMTTAWAHYVNSNNLLSELRGMTKNYPFSSECLDEAKWRVIGDPKSTKSWNYCWLILTKIKNE